MKDKNLGDRVISDFGAEWSRFKFLEDSDKSELEAQAARYLAPIKEFLDNSNEKIAIADFGAGSGRWSEFLLPFASTFVAIEPSKGAFSTLEMRFKERPQVKLLNQKIEDCNLENECIDLAVSLGVIHHIPDSLGALQSIHAKLKPKGRLLCYLYYDFENRKATFKFLWRVSNFFRFIISKLPQKIKFIMCDLIALVVYFPLAKFAKFLELRNFSVSNFPLSHYRKLPFKVMRNDSLDRFGTRLEKRFSRNDIEILLKQAGFDAETIRFSDGEPFWTFVVQRS